MKKYILIFLALILTLSMAACDTISKGDMSDDDFKQAYEKALNNFVQEDYDATITYKSLEMESDSHMGKLVKYTGKIEKIEKTSDGKADVYHLFIENDSSKKLWAQTSASGKSVMDAVAADDTVNLYGIMYGTNLFTPIIYVVKMEKTDEIKGTRSNPFKIGDTATYNSMDSYISSQAFIAEITALEVIRGQQATDMFSNDPEEGKEFFLVKFKIKAIETKNDDEKVKLSNSSFEIVSKNGTEYKDRVSATGIKDFEAIYTGGETEGYFAYIINAGDEPLICFKSNSSNTWFSFAE